MRAAEEIIIALGGALAPPSGFVFLVDSDGYYLTDRDGYYLLDKA